MKYKTPDPLAIASSTPIGPMIPLRTPSKLILALGFVLLFASGFVPNQDEPSSSDDTTAPAQTEAAIGLDGAVHQTTKLAMVPRASVPVVIKDHPRTKLVA